MNIEKIQAQLAAFAKERDWEQFHSPKNLAMALSGEAGELLEIFQWLTQEQSEAESLSVQQLEHAAAEIADITIYALRLADQLGIDLEEAIRSKMERNSARYTVELSKGNALKR